MGVIYAPNTFFYFKCIVHDNSMDMGFLLLYKYVYCCYGILVCQSMYVFINSFAQGVIHMYSILFSSLCFYSL